MGIFLAGRQKGRVASVDIDDDLNDDIRRFEFGLVMGGSYSPTKWLNVGARYQFGMLGIHRFEVGGHSESDTFNRVLHFYAATTF